MELAGGNTVSVYEVTSSGGAFLGQEGYQNPSYSMVGSALASGATQVTDGSGNVVGVSGTAAEGRELGSEPLITATTENALTTGSLSVSKEVTADEGLTAPSGTFEFEVHIDGLGGSVPYTLTFADGTSSEQWAQFTEGVATIELSDGQTATFEGIADGTAWSVTEKNVPAGFENVSEDQAPSGTVTAGEASSASFTNRYVGFGLDIYKGAAKGSGSDVTADPETPLQGAEFTLYAADGSTVVATGVTGDDGHVVLSGLGDGTYYLEETAAPAGYELLGQRITVVVSNGQATLTLGDSSRTVEPNEEGNFELSVADEETPVLPQAGGSGVTPLYAAGAATAAGGAALVARAMRRRRA